MELFKNRLRLLIRSLFSPWTLAVIVGAVGITAFQFRWLSRPRADEQSRDTGPLFVAPNHLDFGEAWENSKFSWVVPIENRSQADVEIQDFLSSCNCTAIDPRNLTIPAGQTRDVQLTLDLAAEKKACSEAEYRDFEVSLRPRIGGDLSESFRPDWMIHGRVHAALRLDRLVIDLGRHSEAAQPLPLQEVLLTSYVPLQRVIAMSDVEELPARVEAVPNSSNRFRLLLSPRPLLLGSISAQITLTPFQSEDERLPRKAVQVTGWIVTDVQPSPPMAAFGARLMGEVVEETLSLYSLTGQPFQITEAHTQGGGLVVEKVASAPNAGSEFTLRQSIIKAGEQDNKVTFSVRTEDSKQREIVVRVSYLGITGSLP